VLIKDGLLDKDVVFGVIEVHKTSAEGFRLVEERDSGQISNPRIGAWEPIDEQEAIVCNTGWPFRFPGTVQPLCVRIVTGQLNLEKILEDTFGMSQLCWPVPDRYMRLSVDLKLCDDYLRSIAASADEDEGLFGEDEPERVEEGERLAVGWNA